MIERRGDWMQTFTGRAVWPIDPHPDDVDLLDIAHALAFQCRFGGHSRMHFSVAQHSILVSRLCPPPLRLAGLLHDASEAYVADIVRPLKRDLGPRYAEVETGWQWAIGRALGAIVGGPAGDRLPGELAELAPQVKHADEVVLATEKRDLMATPPRDWQPLPAPMEQTLRPMSAAEAEQAFLTEWFVITKRVPTATAPRR